MYKVSAKTDLTYNLQNFEFSMLSEDHLFEAQGKRKGNKLLIDIITGDQKRKQEYELKNDYIPATIEGLVKSGKTGKFEFFDPTLQSLFEIEVSNLGVDTLDGIPMKKYKVKESGINIYFWVSDKGELVRSESPIGLVMKKEETADIEDIEAVDFKLYDSYAIKVKNEQPEGSAGRCA